MIHDKPHFDADDVCYCSCAECRYPEHAPVCVCPECIHAG